MTSDSEILEVFGRLTLELAGQQDPEQVLQKALSSALTLCGGDSGTVYLRLETGQLEMSWAVGETLHPPGSRLEPGEGVTGAVVQSGQALLVNDYVSWPGKSPLYQEQRSVMAAPLTQQHEVIGALTLATELHGDAYTEADLKLLQRFADFTSVILENARLNRSLRQAYAAARYRSEQHQRVQQAIAAALTEGEPVMALQSLIQGCAQALECQGGICLVGPNGALNWLIRPRQNDNLPQRLGEGLVGRVAERGTAMLVSDYRNWPERRLESIQTGLTSVMAAPLKRGPEVAGVVTLERFEGQDLFAEDDLEALIQLAAVASGMLESVYLYEEAHAAQARSEEHRALLDSLSQASLELVAERDPNELLHRLTKHTRSAFNAEIGLVYLLGSDGQHFGCVAWDGIEPPRSGVVGQGLSGQVMAKVTAMRVDDYSTWEERVASVPDSIPNWAAMSAPLFHGAAVIGALTIARQASLGRFSDADLETLQRFAAFTSLALEKVQLLEEAKHANQDTLRQLAQLEALDTLSLQLLEQRAPNEVVRHTLNALISLVGASAGAYWRFHQSDDQLELTMVQNVPERFLGTRLAAQSAATAAVVHRGQSLLIEDYQALAGRNSMIPTEFHAMIFTPMTSNQQVIGMITLAHHQANQFSAHDLETAKRFSALGSVALENARLLDGMRRAEVRASDRNALLEALHQVNLELGSYVRLQPLLASILERAVLMLGSHHGRLYLLEPDGLNLRLAAQIGDTSAPSLRLGQGVSGSVAQTGRSLLIGDIPSWPGSTNEPNLGRSVISVPLKRGTEILGALTVSDTQHKQRYTALDIEVLERLAATAGLALEKAQLLEDTRLAERAATERAQQLEALYQVSLELSGQLEFRQLLKSILERAAQLLDVNAGGVYLNDSRNGDTVLAAKLGYHPAKRVKLGEGVSGRVALTGKTLLIGDYQTWSERVPSRGSTWRSVASVPLRRGAGVVGALTLADTEKIDRFSAQDLEVLDRFAALASLALENARLYAKERQNLSDERIRLRITQDIARLQNVPDTAKALLETLAEALGYQHLSLYQREHEDLRLLAELCSPELASAPERLSVNQGLVAQVVQSGKAALLNDETHEALICLPLQGRNGLLGTLHVHSDKKHQLKLTNLEMLEALSPAFATALENATLHSQLERKARELEVLRLKAERAARYDPLTKLRNRRAFEEDLQKALEQHRDDTQPFALAVMDLAGFKAVNDSLGHAAGDEALCRIARVLSKRGSHSRSSHRAYRMGGDEFAILIPGVMEPMTLLKRIVADIKALKFDGGLRVTPNIGLAVCPTDTQNLDRLQSLADKRMYVAKALGQALLEGDELYNPPAPKRRVDD